MNLTPLQPEFPQDRDFHITSPPIFVTTRPSGSGVPFALGGSGNLIGRQSPPCAQVGIQESTEEKQGFHVESRLSSPAPR